MEINRTDIHNILIILGLAILFFFPFLGNHHLFDWDEINFAESAREMIVSGDYLTVQVNFEPFWEKPPLFIWMQVLSMKIFGINEFAARFPNAICGIVTLLTLYLIGKKTFNREFGLLWTLIYAGSFLPFFYFKSGIIDPYFNLFTFVGIYFAVKVVSNESKNWSTFLSALFVGLAILTKGPVALLVFGLVGIIYLITIKFKISFSFKQIIIFILTLSLVGGTWFILQILNGNFSIIKDFIEYQIRLFQTQDAGHGGFAGYHFIILLLGVFPASLFGILGHKKSKTQTEHQQKLKRIMIILLWVVLILFTLVKTKIVHYSSLAYFPITFLATFAVRKLLNKRFILQSWLPLSIIIIGAIISVFTIAFPLVDNYKEWLIASDFIKDEFAKAQLMAEANWSGFESIGGIILLSGIIFFAVQFKTNLKKSIIALYISSAIFMFSSMTLIFPRVLSYTQLSTIEFYKSKKNEEAYVHCLYKSYAPLFYGERKIYDSKKSENRDWLLTGDIDKVVYFVMRNTQKDFFISNYPELKIIEEKDGQVFCKREPNFK